MIVYHGDIIAGGGTIVLSMTRAEYEANKEILDSADVWVDLIDEPDQVATAEQIAYSVDGVQKGMGYIGDIATKAIAKVEPSDTALYLHEVGEYFINKDGDACKVDSQIPVNGTITLGTNCHVLPKGVANDINSNSTANNADLTSVEINNYTISNPYVAPSDGYIYLYNNGIAGHVDIQVKGANNLEFGWATASQALGAVMLYVRKGMLIGVSHYDSNSGARFIAIVN